MEKQLFMANRLREVLLDGHWIANTNYQEQLIDTNWQQAVYKINTLNSIAALTYHINYYLEGLLSAFRTGKIDISDKYSFDVPEISSESDWKALVQRFLTHAARFADAIEGLEEKRLEQPFIEESYGSYLRNIEGVIEHSYYHLGQIVLIKKLIVSQQTH
ncbi:DinB family protein [Sphingobacterium thalpophilum]|uniref:DinB superfamily n=1 Tax=Sphingobacterium thalpophilum TaxID=259 RepID=A0A4U9VA51_9SPHI|nr:DinB family protein [Sphingobacterium thalpophilum]VTR42677.1 DinB superfamily [Sphingobacterium thalpophilum]